MFNHQIRIFCILVIIVLFCPKTTFAMEQWKTKYIVYSYTPDQYFTIVQAAAKALHLPPPGKTDVKFVEHNETNVGTKDFQPTLGFSDVIKNSHNVDWVCIAHYDKCRPVAELSRDLYEQNRIDVNFHSILFFDSDPIERIHGALTEKISKSASNQLLDIKFEKVLHRVYNFYSEKSMAAYRKIYPADQYIKTSDTLTKTNWLEKKTPYLKGVNIKCFNITKDNTLNDFNFSKKVGWISEYGPSDDLVNAAEKIGQIIGYIDNSYLINTDLTAILANESLVTNSDVIPNKTILEPMVIINRPTHWDGLTLSQVIASEGKIVGATKWTLAINSAAEKDRIFSQIAAEANINANVNVTTPYFYPWMKYYRSLNIKSGTPAYQWFDQLDIVKNEPHKKQIAYATIPSPNTRNYLCNAEREYLNARKIIVQESLPFEENKLPKIAVVASGGGIRAMLATLGFLRGLEEVKLSETRTLLDAITYICGLSGSTWAIGPWIASEKNIANYIIDNHIIEKVNNFKGISGALSEIAKNFKTTTDNQIKTVFGQSWTFVDSWGLYISKNLLINPNMQLSQQTLNVTNGKKPFPIYTAVDAEPRNRDWFEFTPFEIGSITRNVYIPSWSFGRQFIAGISQDFPPEQSFGYLLGIFGSAMGARVKDVIGPKITAAEWNITSGSIPNFYFGMKDIAGNTENNIELVDAGAAFNLPYPPISGINSARKADIIIFVDASGEFGQEIGGEIRKTVAWQLNKQQNGYPEVKLPTAMNDWCSQKNPITRNERIHVFNGDARQGIPTVIYMPIALDLTEDTAFPFDDKQKYFIDTFNNTHKTLLTDYTNKNLMEKYPTTTFNYTQPQSNFLLDLMTLNVQISINMIMDAIHRHSGTMS